MREKLDDVHSRLMGLLQRAPYIGCADTDRQYAVNWLMNHGVTVSSEIEELRADNKRLREMWVHTFSELSKCNAEKMEYKRMLDNAYEMIGKITDRWG